MPNRTYCCVFGCHSSGKDKTISFHLFPRTDERQVIITNKFGVQEKCDRRVAWERVLSMGKKASNRMTVCSRHFSDDCYFLPGIPALRRHLKKNVVPNQNLPALPKRGTVMKSPKTRRILHRISGCQQHECLDEYEGANNLEEEGGNNLEGEGETVLTHDLGNLISFLSLSCAHSSPNRPFSFSKVL